MTPRTSTVDFAAAMAILNEQIESHDGVANALIAGAGERLLEQRRLLEAALPAVELFGDVATLKSIKQELGL